MVEANRTQLDEVASEALLSNPLCFYISQLVSIGEVRSERELLLRMDQAAGVEASVRMALLRLADAGLIEFDHLTGVIGPRKSNFRVRFTGPVQARLFPAMFSKLSLRAVSDLVVSGYPPVMFCFSDDPETEREIRVEMDLFRVRMREIGDRARTRKVQGLRAVGMFNSRLLGRDVVAHEIEMIDEDSNERLLRSVRQSSDAMRFFAHDVRGIVGALKALRDFAVRGTMAQQLELINSIIEKLDRSVESFNRGTSAQTGTDTVSLVELINRVRLLATPSLPADIKFTCDTRLHGSHACPADPNLIEDLLMNLIKNSCESLVTSGCGGSLGLLVSQNDAGISFRVLDSGPGLSEKAYDEIFVNRRVYTSKPGGWGEGLLGVMNRLRSLGSDLEYFRVDGVTIFQFVLR